MVLLGSWRLMSHIDLVDLGTGGVQTSGFERGYHGFVKNEGFGW